MPEPMTAPMPNAVSDQGPRVFLSAFSGCSDSRMSLSIDLRASSWLSSSVLLAPRAQLKRGDSHKINSICVGRSRETASSFQPLASSGSWLGGCMVCRLVAAILATARMASDRSPGWRAAANESRGGC